MSTLSSNPLPICPKCNKPMPFLSESAGMPKVERFNCKACKVLCRIEMEFDYYGESTTVEPETECGACDKPGEHCARPYGICVRHCKPKARDEQEDAYNAAARVMADKASTVSPPSADIEALLESFVWAVRRDNDARDKYTQQEVKDLRAELLAAIRPVQPPEATLDERRYAWLKLHAPAVFLDQHVQLQTKNNLIHVSQVSGHELDEAIDCALRGAECPTVTKEAKL
jgi:hypothetical protein